MPEFTFTGTTEHTFPESRHSDGTPVRSVEPGEIRDLPEAIDHQWRETTDEDREARAAVLAAREAAEQMADDVRELSAGGLDAGVLSELAQAEPPKQPRAQRKDKTVTASEAGTAGGSED